MTLWTQLVNHKMSQIKINFIIFDTIYVPIFYGTFSVLELIGPFSVLVMFVLYNFRDYFLQLML